MKVIYDCETSRFPDGNPYRPSNHMVSWGTRGPEGVGFGYHTDADFATGLREHLSIASLLVGINLKFDIAWARRYNVVIPKGCRIWDCQLAEFILSGQTVSFASMDMLCDKYGIPNKQGGLEDYWNQGIDTKDIPYDVVKSYNLADLDRTDAIYEAQQKDPRMTPELHKLILLDGADLLVLQKMEENGLKYDIGRSQSEGERLKVELVSIEKELKEYTNGADINLDSGDHLSAFLYGGWYEIDYFTPTELVYKSGERKGQAYTQNKFRETIRYEFPGLFNPLRRSEVAKSTKERPIYQTSEPVLKQLRAGTKRQKRVIELLLRRAELAKLVDTYFLKLPQRIKEMEWGDIVHGEYNQVVARTGRLSSSKPNLQNLPPSVDRLIVTRF